MSSNLEHELSVSVVIPSYNRRETILSLLTDIDRQEYRKFEVIVVDDGSTDGTFNAIISNFPSVRLIKNSKNLGPAQSRNNGISEASGDIVIGLDSDTSITDRKLFGKIIKFFGIDSRVHCLAMRILNSDGLTDDAERWWHPLPYERFSRKSFSTDYFSGTAYAARKDAVLSAGSFPSILYMHYEEVELAWRIMDLGGEIRYAHDLVVIHHAKATCRRGHVQVFLKPRNQILLAVSCLPIIQAICFAVPRVSYQLSKSVRNGHLIDFLRSMKSAYALFPDQLKLRKPICVKTLKKINDFRSRKNIPGCFSKNYIIS